MALTELTKITGVGIHTQSNINSHNINSTGIITATQFDGDINGGGTFTGDISNATGTSAGLGTAISSDNTKPLNLIYYVNDTLHVTENSLVDLPATSTVAYTQFSNIQVEDNMNLTVNDDVEFVPDILNLSDFM